MAIGLLIGFYLWFDQGVTEVTSAHQIDVLIDQPFGYEILGQQFVYADQENDLELTRHALVRLQESGSISYELVFALNSILNVDDECRWLYLSMLEQELDSTVLSLVSLSKSLHRENDSGRYQHRVNLIIDYLGFDRSECEQAVNEGGKEAGQQWLVDNADRLRAWLSDKDRHKKPDVLIGNLSN